VNSLGTAEHDGEVVDVELIAADQLGAPDARRVQPPA
jgi:hypothetical protein